MIQAFRFLAFFMLCVTGAFPCAAASDPAPAATLDAAASGVTDDGAGIALDLALSRAVPFRAIVLSDPPRLVVDVSEVDFGAVPPETLDRSGRVAKVAWGPVRAGWSRVVAMLDGPYRIENAGERGREGGAAVVSIRLVPTTPDDLAERAAAVSPEAGRWALPEPVPVAAPKRRQTGDAPLVVVLDPGHGGIDPGAEAGGRDEADVMLSFALELAGLLRRAGMEVVLTREDDDFVPLETRISIARSARADVFLSLHADALAEGRASGATVYLLAADASDAASAKLAERHDRADLLAGVDLTRQEDSVALVMMDMARAETRPRSDMLAREIAGAIGEAGIRLHRHPIQKAAFSVLKSPDIPSILLEVGFLSSPGDRKRLADPEWRERMQGAILNALQSWRTKDAAEARLVRR